MTIKAFLKLIQNHIIQVNDGVRTIPTYNTFFLFCNTIKEISRALNLNGDEFIKFEEGSVSFTISNINFKSLNTHYLYILFDCSYISKINEVTIYLTPKDLNTSRISKINKAKKVESLCFVYNYTGDLATKDIE